MAEQEKYTKFHTKQEGERLQLELCVAHVEKIAHMFEEVFGMYSIENSPGWCHLRHPKHYDIMLIAPTISRSGKEDLPDPGTGGMGLEIVICTKGIPEKRTALQHRGYPCSELRYPPWGSVEFIFTLQEGYSIRVKQPPELRESVCA